VIKISVFTFVALVACSSFASAQSASGSFGNSLVKGEGRATSSGPNLSGKFDSKVQAKDVTATAKGDGAVARNVIGSATDGNATDFHSEVDVGNVSANADGSKACAENIIGSMGSSACTGSR